MSKKKKNEIEKISAANAVSTLNSLAQGIADGTIGGYSFNHSSDGTISFKVDSPDGQNRVIRNHYKADGYSRDSEEQIRKMPPEERRNVVKKLLDEGRTQTEIADRTMYSQKTISNDVRKLKDRGDI